MNYKPFIAIIISSTLFINSSAFAETVKVPSATSKETNISDKVLKEKSDLEKIKKAVMLKLEIPQELENFTSSHNNYSDKETWSLQWSNQSQNYSGEYKYVQAVVDKSGNILNYNKYVHSTYTGIVRKLPKLNPQKAGELAKRFVFLIRPDLYSELSFDKGLKNYMLEHNGNYSFTFNRVYKNIPYYGNSINISIDGQTGSTLTFACNWSDNLKFPDTKSIIGIDAAKTLFQKNIGLNLTFRKKYVSDKNENYIAYIPKVSDEPLCIDAFTGGLAIDNIYENPFARNDRNNIDNNILKSNDKIALNLEDIKEIPQIMSLEAAEKSVRSMAELGLDKAYTLMDFSYYKNKSAGSYIIMMNFGKTLTKSDFDKNISDEEFKMILEKEKYSTQVNVEMDAKTAELLSFQNNNHYNRSDDKKSILDRDKAQKIAENFLKKYKPTTFNELEYIPATVITTADKKDKYMAEQGMPTINFIRVINGIKFLDNGVSIDIDPVSGNIKNYRQEWESINTPSLEGTITSDKAYDIFFKDIGFELKYIAPFNNPYTEKGTNNVLQLKLVYALDISIPSCIDAKSGKIISLYNGMPYIEKGSTQYKDIDSSSLKDKIIEMENAGLLFSEETFRPDDALLQKELVYLLLLLKGQSPANSLLLDFGQQTLDNMYRYAVNLNIIKPDEKSPDRKVTREELIKYVLNLAGYSNIADIKGIFICDFEDKDDISVDLKGYAAIAKSLNLIKGSKFYPKKNITRAEAVEVLYDLLKNER